MVSFDVTSPAGAAEIARLISSQIQSAAGAHNEAGIKKATAQTKNDQLTIILQIQSSESVSAQSHGSKDSYLIEAQVVYRIKENQMVPENQGSISFYSQKPLSQGELLAVSAEQSGQTLQLQPKSLSHINMNTQVQLNSLISKISDPGQITESAQYFKPVMQLINNMMTQLPQMIAYPAVQELAAVIAQQTTTRPPLEWLAEQSLQFSTQSDTPDWVKNIPSATQRNLHQQNMNILNSVLDQLQNYKTTLSLPTGQVNTAPQNIEPGNTVINLKNLQLAKIYATLNQEKTTGFKILRQIEVTPHDNILSKQFLNQMTLNPQDTSVQEILNKLQTWVQLQKRWIESPETILNNPRYFLQMLPQTTGGSLMAIHLALEQLWPSYVKAGQQLSHLSQEIQALQQLSTHQPEQNLMRKILQLVQQEDESIEISTMKGSHLNALALRTGIAESIQSIISQTTADDSQQKVTLMTSPLPLSHPETKAWMQVSAQTDRHVDEKNKTQIIQILTLDFNTNKYGAIRFELKFNEGFCVPVCSTDIWMEHASQIHFFQTYESQLMDRLSRIGLSVQGCRWRQGNPAEAELQPGWRPKFQIDQYV